MEIDIDDDREENKDIGFILVDSLKKDVLDTSLKMSSFLETFENFFKKEIHTAKKLLYSLPTWFVVLRVICDKTL